MFITVYCVQWIQSQTVETSHILTPCTSKIHFHTILHTPMYVSQAVNLHHTSRPCNRPWLPGPYPNTLLQAYLKRVSFHHWDEVVIMRTRLEHFCHCDPTVSLQLKHQERERIRAQRTVYCIKKPTRGFHLQYRRGERLEKRSFASSEAFAYAAIRFHLRKVASIGWMELAHECVQWRLPHYICSGAVYSAPMSAS
jgi:hypothetical protein